MTSRYGISEYPDVPAVQARLAELTSTPIRTLTKEQLEEYHDWYAEHTPASRTAAAEAAAAIPGGVQHNLALNDPWALDIVAASGAYLYDADGNRYVDFLQAGGPTVLGSNYEPVREKVIELLATCGPVTGMLHSSEIALAKLIHDFMPGVQKFRMLGSGSEAVMAAIRAARAFTGKANIIKIGGAYHGWSDQVVYGMRLPGTGRMEAVGIPHGSTAYTQECHPNDLDALRRKLQLNRWRGGTAAVLVEPIGPESGTRPVTRDYNTQVRALCDEYGALLIFDEVVIGFRLGMGGAQAYFNVKPDLTVLGKCLTGGYPMAGAIGGRRDVMMLLVGGIGTTSRRAFVGGTLSANPLSCAAGYFALQEAQRTDAAAAAGRAGDRLRQGLEQIIARLSLPYVVYNIGSIVHLQTSGVLLLDTSNIIKLLRKKDEAKARKHMMEEMGAAYSAHGLVTLAGSRIYTSLADTDTVIDDALNRFEDVFKLV
jgi:glutamate-1-semialdehyde 2,1-aminomutase